MFRLKGGTHFLVLQQKGKDRLIYGYPRFDEAFAHWDSSSRVSPIFALDDSPPPSCRSYAKSWLTFLGPVYPGDVWLHLDADQINHRYLSLGFLNMVFFCTDQAQLLQFQSLKNSLRVAWEEWELEENLIKRIEYGSSLTAISNEASQAFKLELSSPTARECQALLATSAAAAGLDGRADLNTFRDYNAVLRGMLSKPDLTPTEKLQSLSIASVALSYHHWQTYAGSPPIMENRPHLATHSLLGIGSASIALENLARYLENIFDNAMIPQRLLYLGNVKSTSKSLVQLTARDKFWDFDHLFDHEPLFPAANYKNDPDNPRGPHLTYFSAPDGFRSTGLSLSAPLEAITGCNTPSWTLQTLTHEISHTVVRSVLGSLLPNINPPDLDEINAIFNALTTPNTKNFLYEIKAFLIFGLWKMTSRGEILSVAEIPDLILKNSKEADEILTHIFDFLYHYRNDPDLYVKSIWASWATIPHIEDRIDEYVVRTLCSLHATNLRRENGIDITFKQTVNSLEDLRSNYPDLAYIPEAISALAQDKKHYVDSLESRVPLIKFSRYFLWSKKISEQFTGESEAALNETNFRSQQFSDKKIQNPLRFIEECSQDKTPEPIKSVWILQHLAYGIEP